MFVLTAVRGISQWNKNNHSPRLTVPAIVVAKRTNELNLSIVQKELIAKRMNGNIDKEVMEWAETVRLKKCSTLRQKAGFHATKSERVNAPLIDELPMALECKVKSFEDGILVGEIVNVAADESVVTDGKIDPKKLKPIAYDPANNTYLALGDVVGKAFADGLKLK